MICSFYVTLRCSDTCEFCTIWNNEEYQSIRESDYQTIENKLKEIKNLGVKELNVTGGEPLLREDLPQILLSAKNLGFKITLTTNCMLYPEKARNLIGLVNCLYFSLDAPSADMHNRIRGVECFDEVIKSIRIAKALKERPIINFTITRETILLLPEMIDLATSLDVLLNINPVYDHGGLQGFEKDSLDYIRYFAKRKNVLINLAVLKFIKDGGNNVMFPRCRAKQATVTMLPDGSFVSPCFFLREVEQGKAAICSNCLRWDYIVPSFKYRLDKYFVLDLYSNWNNSRKIYA